jgi:quinoprotein glucose dehydrogenase
MGGSAPEFPSLIGIGKKRSAAELTQTISAGRVRMPAFGQLGKEPIAAIVDYISTGADKTVEFAKLADSGMKYGTDGYNKFLDPDGYPAVKPPWGTLNAINLDTGDFAWKVPFGEYPELAAKGLKQTGAENYGGGVVTAGGLLFIAATNYDKKMHAFDKSTGALLWEADLPAAGNASVVTYDAGGKQFVVIGAGGGKSKAATGGSYIAFGLP